jgi:hypothetical protein
LRKVRALFIEQRLAADKVAALRAVGMEFDGGKAQAIRKQLEAQNPLGRPGSKGKPEKLDIKRSCSVRGRPEKACCRHPRVCQEHMGQESENAKVGAKRSSRPAHAAAAVGSARGKVRTKAIEV